MQAALGRVGGAKRHICAVDTLLGGPFPAGRRLLEAQLAGPSSMLNHTAPEQPRPPHFSVILSQGLGLSLAVGVPEVGWLQAAGIANGGLR